MLLCPSDGTATPTRVDCISMEGTVIGNTSYKGVSGSNHQWGMYPNPDPVTGSFDGYGNGNGPLWEADIRTKVLELADITDGTSTTFLIGEDVPVLNTHACWCYSHSAVGNVAIPPNAGITHPPFNEPPGSEFNLYSFRSRHPGGVQFAYADGSVHFIRDMIPLNIYRAMGTIRAGEVVPADP
jgi:prepilin-type processing-associated H-X9-DG protein